jgi:hypothetical protein
VWQIDAVSAKRLPRDGQADSVAGRQKWNPSGSHP